MLKVLEGSVWLTRNQQLVLDVLAGSSVPLSAYAILAALRTSGIRSPVPVYRALERLVSIGMAHRIESLAAFVACSGGHGHEGCTRPSAFAICDACGRVRELSDRAIGERLSDLAGREGFELARSCVELRGTCSDCASVRT